MDDDEINSRDLNKLIHRYNNLNKQNLIKIPKSNRIESLYNVSPRHSSSNIIKICMK